jgi:hypothetical protein
VTRPAEQDGEGDDPPFLKFIVDLLGLGS